jgi:hypothetical protein
MTPIDLLVNRLAENGILHSSDVAEANELFKQQIINAWSDVGADGVTTAEEYYNETFKNTKE